MIEKKKIEMWHGALLVIAIVLLIYIGVPLLSGQATYINKLAVCRDRDGDGYGVSGLSKCRFLNQRDCNDNNFFIHPGANEACNIDANCDGVISKTAGCPVCYDTDKASNLVIPGYVYGSFFGQDYKVYDKCINQNILRENYCDGYGLVGGAPIYEDVYCKDGKVCVSDYQGIGYCAAKRAG